MLFCQNKSGCCGFYNEWVWKKYANSVLKIFSALCGFVCKISMISEADVTVPPYFLHPFSKSKSTVFWSFFLITFLKTSFCLFVHTDSLSSKSFDIVFVSASTIPWTLQYNITSLNIFPCKFSMYTNVHQIQQPYPKLCFLFFVWDMSHFNNKLMSSFLLLSGHCGAAEAQQDLLENFSPRNKETGRWNGV